MLSLPICFRKAEIKRPLAHMRSGGGWQWKPMRAQVNGLVAVEQMNTKCKSVLTNMRILQHMKSSNKTLLPFMLAWPWRVVVESNEQEQEIIQLNLIMKHLKLRTLPNDKTVSCNWNRRLGSAIQNESIVPWKQPCTHLLIQKLFHQG